MNSTSYVTLRVGCGNKAGAGLTIELVFNMPETPRRIATGIQAILPGAEVEVETAFGGAEDRFLFATFRSLEPRGRESHAFCFSRELAGELGATEGNPVLADGLWDGIADVAQGEPGSVHLAINTFPAWEKTRGAGTTVAVIDTGVLPRPGLDPAILSNGHANFVEGGTDARERPNASATGAGHGTMIASLIAARASEVGGVAPEARILPVRALSSVTTFKQRTIPRAIAHAVQRGADVITLAFGGPTRVVATEQAMRDAVQSGCVIVCAAGNCLSKLAFPAHYEAEGLCFVAADPSSEHAARLGLAVAAPKTALDAAGPDDRMPVAGSDVAAALASGVAALWISRHGGRASLQVHALGHETTVQSLFGRCIETAARPADCAMPMIDAAATLDMALPDSAEGARHSLACLSTPDLLRRHLSTRAPDVAEEFDASVAPFAGEILWRSYRLSGDAIAEPSEPFRELLKDKPRIRAFVDA